MLILERESGEEAIITVPPSTTPTRVRFVVVNVRGAKVRCGFDAPKNTKIHRAEVQHQIDLEGVSNTPLGPA